MQDGICAAAAGMDGKQMKGTGLAAKMLEMEQLEFRAALWNFRAKELRVLGKLGVSAMGNWAHLVPEIT